MAGVVSMLGCEATNDQSFLDQVAAKFDVSITDGAVDIEATFTRPDSVPRTLDEGASVTATLDGSTIDLVDNGSPKYVGHFASYTDLTLAITTNYQGDDIVSTAQLPTHVAFGFVPDPWSRVDLVTIPRDTNDLSGEITSFAVSGDCILAFGGNLPKSDVDIQLTGTGSCPVTLELARLPPPETAHLGGGFYPSPGFAQIYERVHVTVLSTP